VHRLAGLVVDDQRIDAGGLHPQLVVVVGQLIVGDGLPYDAFAIIVLPSNLNHFRIVEKEGRRLDAYSILPPMALATAAPTFLDCPLPEL
jgi:hypothetical protein